MWIGMRLRFSSRIEWWFRWFDFHQPIATLTTLNSVTDTSRFYRQYRASSILIADAKSGGHSVNLAKEVCVFRASNESRVSKPWTVVTTQVRLADELDMERSTKACKWVCLCVCVYPSNLIVAATDRRATNAATCSWESLAVASQLAAVMQFSSRSCRRGNYFIALDCPRECLLAHTKTHGKSSERNWNSYSSFGNFRHFSHHKLEEANENWNISLRSKPSEKAARLRWLVGGRGEGSMLATVINWLTTTT